MTVRKYCSHNLDQEKREYGAKLQNGTAINNSMILGRHNHKINWNKTITETFIFILKRKFGKETDIK